MSEPSGGWEVVVVGVLATVQDAGRPGWAHLGVPRAGWLDPPAAELANRLVGNPADAAVVEVALGGLVLRAGRAAWIAVTGAPCPVWVDDRPVGHGRPERVAAGSELRLGPVVRGVRSYLALAGGVAVEPVLGSRSTDTLGGVGPAPLAPGDPLPLGARVGVPAAVDAAVPGRGSGGARSGLLRVDPGPRADWFGEPAALALAVLCASAYVVGSASDRIGLRLQGPPLARLADRDGQELASEAMVLGAVQVPPDGQPVVFLADHPTTGGYPVVAVVRRHDLAGCAQLAPGEAVRFIPARGVG